MSRRFAPVAPIALLLGIACPLHAAAAADISYEMVDGSNVILIRGDIAHGDDSKFRRLALQHQDALVVLDSVGGALIPAIEIGKAIHLSGYNTLVGDGSVCTSACALIWIAGSARYLSEGGKLGFHASYTEEAGRQEETGVGNALVGHYLTLLNLPEKAIVFATVAAPDQIQWLTAQNMERSGISFQSLKDSTNETTAADARVAWSGSERTFDGWNVSSLEGLNSCLMGAKYENEEYLAVGYDADADAAMIVITHKNATSLRTGDERQLDITFVRGNGVDAGWHDISFTASVASDDRRMLRSEPLEPQILTDFALSTGVGIYYKNRLVGSYDLNGSSAGVSALKRCARDVSH